jgi:hypothetical protein
MNDNVQLPVIPLTATNATVPARGCAIRACGSTCGTAFNIVHSDYTVIAIATINIAVRKPTMTEVPTIHAKVAGRRSFLTE